MVGTVNYRALAETWPAPVTTPESLDLQRLLRAMRSRGVSHVVMEVSSHALDLRRVDRTAFDVGVFTNFSQDHLDYHRDLDDYFAAKARLLYGNAGQRQRRPRSGGPQPGQSPGSGTTARAQVRVPCLTYGSHPESQVRPFRGRFHPPGDRGPPRQSGGRGNDRLPPGGALQPGQHPGGRGHRPGAGPYPLRKCPRGIAALNGVPGRLGLFGPAGGPGVFVDYAHTPDALAQALGALQQLDFARIITVFGCGGDRDRKKRPLMGTAAALSHLVLVTSDNPRSEEPLAIIREIEPGLAAAGLARISGAAARKGESGYLLIPGPPGGHPPGDQPGPARRRRGVLVAGKGHEHYQIWGSERRELNNREEVTLGLKECHG